MDILFVSSFSSDEYSAHTHNLPLLKKGFDKLGLRSNVFYLGDHFFKTPRLLQPLNIPSLLKLIRDYEVVFGWGADSSYVLGLAKILANFKIIFCVRGVHVEESY